MLEFEQQKKLMEELVKKLKESEKKLSFEIENRQKIMKDSDQKLKKTEENLKRTAAKYLRSENLRLKMKRHNANTLRRLKRKILCLEKRSV